MARAKATKTTVQIAADKAREVYKTAKETLEKTDNAVNKKAVVDAKTALDIAETSENRERFISLGGVRVGKVLKALDTFAACAKTDSYEFTADDISKAMQAITDRTTTVQKKFDSALQGEKATSTQTTFKFA